MTIRNFSEKDAEETSKMICKVLLEFVAKDWTEQAVAKMLQEQSPQTLISHMKNRKQYVAVSNENKIIGYIEGRDNSRISRLFINKDFHKQGIGTILFKKMESLFKMNNSKKIIVHSSLYAEKF